jgi:hypothetical protein
MLGVAASSVDLVSQAPRGNDHGALETDNKILHPLKSDSEAWENVLEEFHGCLQKHPKTQDLFQEALEEWNEDLDLPSSPLTMDLRTRRQKEEPANAIKTETLAEEKVPKIKQEQPEEVKIGESR